MKKNLKLKIAITSTVLVCLVLMYVWKSLFFPQPKIAYTQHEITLEKRAELTKQIYNQIDYLKNLNDAPSYLFKYNLAKVIFLFKNDMPSSEDLFDFKIKLDNGTLNEWILEGMQFDVLSDFDAILLAKMYSNIVDKEDYFLQELVDRGNILDKNLLGSHVAQSYLDMIEKEHQSNNIPSDVSECSKCISVCMNTYTFSIPWWKNYKSVLVSDVDKADGVNDFHHAFFYAESSGLTSCEKEVCKSTCQDNCEDCVPAFVYQEV